ncbi:GIN domain-containing protein [Sphingomonas sp. 1P08PE]|uniref:GIN domain-containing protein n=1 Tax=Sphingomonas sp. 1P08PE TaxID=554122 RepID=UPI0039A1E7B3
MRTPLLAVLLFSASPVAAAERPVAVSSFDRVRVEAPITVRIVTGTSPAARISGSDAAIEGIEVRQSGTAISIRRRTDQWQERPTVADPRPVTVTLTTASLSTITLTGAGDVAVDRMKGQRVDLMVAGAGRVAVGMVDADQATAMVVGGGTVAVAGGRARIARLTTNGAGSIDAAGLDAGDLTVRLEGTGDIGGRARFTAAVTSNGTGTVSIGGTPRCQVRPGATGPIVCGRPQ